jgi:competence transcription factor ComK
MFLHVEDFEIIDTNKLKIQFNNKQTVEVDLKDELEGEVFEPLKDQDFFKKAYLNKETLTVEWPNGADFAPEFLFELGQKQLQRSA